MLIHAVVPNDILCEINFKSMSRHVNKTYFELNKILQQLLLLTGS